MLTALDVVDIPYFKEIRQRIDPGLFEANIVKCYRKLFGPNTYICREGDHATAAYLLEEGEVAFLISLPKQPESSALPLDSSKHNIQHPKNATHKIQVNKATVGQIFGEVALSLPDCRRTASAKALKRTRIIIVPKEVYFLFSVPSLKVDIHEINSPFLNLLSQVDRYKFCNKADRRKFGYKNVVYNIGDPAYEVYYIARGEFKKERGKDEVFAFLEQGSTFGEEEVMRGISRQFKLSCCSSEGLVFVFGKEQFESYYLRSPKVLQGLKQLIANRKQIGPKPTFQSFLELQVQPQGTTPKKNASRQFDLYWKRHNSDVHNKLNLTLRQQQQSRSKNRSKHNHQQQLPQYTHSSSSNSQCIRVNELSFEFENESGGTMIETNQYFENALKERSLVNQTIKMFGFKKKPLSRNITEPPDPWFEPQDAKLKSSLVRLNRDKREIFMRNGLDRKTSMQLLQNTTGGFKTNQKELVELVGRINDSEMRVMTETSSSLAKEVRRDKASLNRLMRRLRINCVPHSK